MPSDRARPAPGLPTWGLALGAVALVAIAGVLAFARRGGPGPEPGPSAAPAGHWAEVGRGRAYLRQGRPDLALEAVSSVRDEAPGSGEAMTVAGLALIHAREFRGARLALERALKLQPDQLDATKALATLHLMLGNGPRGAELLEAATRLDPTDVAAWTALGRVDHDLGRAEAAAGAFEEVLRRAPGDRVAPTALIKELLALHRPVEARRRLDEALARSPDAPDLLGMAARLAREDGRPDSLDLASRALAADPSNLDALMARARTLLADGHPERALPDAEHAVAAHPNDIAALQLLAQVEARLGLADRARATGDRQRAATERAKRMDGLVQKIAARPDDPEPRWQLGESAAEGGADQLAGQCFRAALALDPKCQPALDGLARLSAQGPRLGRP